MATRCRSSPRRPRQTLERARFTRVGCSGDPSKPDFIFGSRRCEKPPGAWTPDQVIDMLVERMDAGDFYIICPDNDVTRDIDNRRIFLAAEDIIHNRPPLSRWHPDYADAFAAFLASDSPFRQ